MRYPRLETRRFTRAEYDRLIAQGFFDEDERIELLDGHLIVREPQGSRHAVTVELVREALQHAFGKGYHVRGHSPVALDDLSEPEPDIAVVRGRLRDYATEHPASPVLVVEVADSSLGKDRGRKAVLYGGRALEVPERRAAPAPGRGRATGGARTPPARRRPAPVAPQITPSAFSAARSSAPSDSHSL